MSTPIARETAAPVRAGTAVTMSALTGLASLALGVLQLASPEQADPFHATTDYLIEYSYALGLWIGVLAIIGLHAVHRVQARWGKIGLAATITFAAQYALLGTAALATAVRGRNSLDILFLLALPLWLVGGVLLAIAVFRAGLLPKTIAVAIGVNLPLTMVVGEAGPLIDGAVWIGIAVALIRVTAQPRH
ncbi:hypothetical protein Pth03_82530 [Planotetraspora thailandica]|uniref:Uncharacterized protein n=1 Tax=Planotetraspora thailandica TaxID=487172 RepID=A0A8J4DFF0_9ACTN|nr:hypothetical protein [Planotetraspora thailandica]GII59864.1 hypothetical protein Pth03_82530 [Planotetraspora thailandica]